VLRTAFVLVILAIGAWYSLRGAFQILLFYLWIAYFRPDEWLWFNFTGGISSIVGLVLLVATVVSFTRHRLRLTGAILFLLLLAHSLLSTLLSPVESYSMPYWIEFAKVIVICCVILALVNTEERLRWVLVIMALSLGFEGARQGWAQLVTAPGTPNMNSWALLGDNNGVAVGMLMLVPVLVALGRTAKKPYERWGAHLLVIGVLYRALSTYSRGGFLAGLTLAGKYLIHARRRFTALIATAIIVAGALVVLPSSYWDRIETLRAPQDSSALSRLYFWKLAWWMANDRPVLGYGHNSFEAVYQWYDVSEGAHGENRSVHSAWFGMLSELGFPGLLLFLLIFSRSLLVGRHVRRLARQRPDLQSLALYATACEGQLIVYAVGASFLPLQYNELLFHVLAIGVAIRNIADARMREAAATPAAAEAEPRRPAPVRLNIPPRAAAGRPALLNGH
jgi:probable O-glycosylation ligase (exosortase A-associated)